MFRAALFAVLLALLFPLITRGDEPKKLTKEELIKKLEKDLSGTKLTGRYTVTGKPDMTPKEETYTITSAMKLEDPSEPNLWLIKAQMSYGGKATTYPIPLLIEWAGDTPMISMTNMEIPMLGTFSCRLLFHEGRYAGTWQHGSAGGHLFGTFEKLPESK
ncbi:MAG: hypothetical protein SFU86_11855 [Pirellulaceae bacterium]|nr:hypothetical protein [Pirellulaceae bacterium]